MIHCHPERSEGSHGDCHMAYTLKWHEVLRFAQDDSGENNDA
jgi:hypothetical protein